MSRIMAISLGIGISCGLYPLIAHILEISVWMSFAGCTSYYVAGGGKKGFIKSMASNYTGIAWAMIVITFGSTAIMQNPGISSLLLGALATGFIAFTMTYQSKLNLLSFIPSTFIGCFSTFGSGGDWKMMSLCILGGNLLGISCDWSGRLLFKIFNKNSEKNLSENIEIAG